MIVRDTEVDIKADTNTKQGMEARNKIDLTRQQRRLRRGSRR